MVQMVEFKGLRGVSSSLGKTVITCHIWYQLPLNTGECTLHIILSKQIGT